MTSRERTFDERVQRVESRVRAAEGRLRDAQAMRRTASERLAEWSSAQRAGYRRSTPVGLDPYQAQVLAEHRDAIAHAELVESWMEADAREARAALSMVRQSEPALEEEYLNVG